jgi:endonuclease YncB( thermonuclease family)
MKTWLLCCLATITPLPNQLLAHEPSFDGVVKSVTDGDTFRMVNLKPAIRVWGLDAPEREEAGGYAATHALSVLISDQLLRCHIKDVDRYGRIVGQCFLPDGRDIAAAMIQLRVAQEYCRYSGSFYGTC